MEIKPGDIVKNREGRAGVVLSVDDKKTLESRCLVLLQGKTASILTRNLFKVVRR